MKKNIKITVSIIIAYLSINILFGYFKTEFYYNFKGTKNHPSESIKASMKKGVFIKKLNIVPREIILKSNTIKIESIWLEHSNTIYFVFTMIPFKEEYIIYKNGANYNICLTLENKSLPKNYSDWFFVIEGNGNGFTLNGKDVYSEMLQDINWKKKKIIFTQNWNFNQSVRFEITQ